MLDVSLSGGTAAGTPLIPMVLLDMTHPSPERLRLAMAAAAAAWVLSSCAGQSANGRGAPAPAAPAQSERFPAEPRQDLSNAGGGAGYGVTGGAEVDSVYDFDDEEIAEEALWEQESPEAEEAYGDFAPEPVVTSETLAMESPSRSFGWGRGDRNEGPSSDNEPTQYLAPGVPEGTTMLLRASNDELERCTRAPESSADRYVYYVDAATLWSHDGVIQRATGDAIAVIQVDAVSYPDRCVVSADGSPLSVEAIGTGGMMILRGVIPTGISSPAEALNDPNIEVVELYGWQVSAGGWETTGADVLAALGAAPTAPVCVSPGLRDHLSDFARTWVHHRIGLGSAPPRDDVAESVDTRFPADRLLLAHFTEGDATPQIATACPDDGDALWVGAFVGQHDSPIPESLAVERPALAAATALMEHDRGERLLGRNLLEDVLEGAPIDPLANLIAGLLLIESGDDLQRAEEHLVIASEDLEYRSLSFYYLGRVFEEQGATVQAMTAYQSALDAGPIMADAANALGYLMFERGNDGQAEALFRQAIVAAPDEALAYSNLGFLLERERLDFSGAEEAYLRAVSLEPLDPVYHYNLGYLYEAHLGRLAEAETEYETATRLSTTYAEAREALEALRARPTASNDLLIGLWQTPPTPGYVQDVTRTVSFDEAGNYRVVERRGHGDPGVFVWNMTWDSEARERAQLVIHASDEDADITFIAEFVNADTLVIIDPDDPGVGRYVLVRHVGDEHASGWIIPRL